MVLRLFLFKACCTRDGRLIARHRGCGAERPPRAPRAAPAAAAERARLPGEMRSAAPSVPDIMTSELLYWARSSNVG